MLTDRIDGAIGIPYRHPTVTCIDCVEVMLAFAAALVANGSRLWRVGR
jgi:hypothetical protein